MRAGVRASTRTRIGSGKTGPGTGMGLASSAPARPAPARAHTRTARSGTRSSAARAQGGVRACGAPKRPRGRVRSGARDWGGPRGIGGRVGRARWVRGKVAGESALMQLGCEWAADGVSSGNRLRSGEWAWVVVRGQRADLVLLSSRCSPRLTALTGSRQAHPPHQPRPPPRHHPHHAPPHRPLAHAPGAPPAHARPARHGRDGPPRHGGHPREPPAAVWLWREHDHDRVHVWRVARDGGGKCGQPRGGRVGVLEYSGGSGAGLGGGGKDWAEPRAISLRYARDRPSSSRGCARLAPRARPSGRRLRTSSRHAGRGSSSCSAGARSRGRSGMGCLPWVPS